MVAALVKGRRIHIHNLDDLLTVVESSIREKESLVLFGDHEERFEFPPITELTDEQNREALLATRGAWKGLVDGEQLKRDIYESRGQAGRSWMVSEDTDVQE